MIYCVVPRDLAPKLHEALRQHFADRPDVEVVVEQRRRERRAVAERRAAEAGTSAPRRQERRRVHNAAGRRVGERRAALVGVAPATPLPRKARAHAGRLLFVERVEPSSERAEDLDTARLVTRIQSGESAGYADLYMRYFERVYSYFRVLLRDTHEAEDLTQQVFVRVLEALPRYERRRQPFRAWLFTIARNLAVDHLKRSNRLQLEEPADVARRRETNGEAEPEQEKLDWIVDRELLLFVERLPTTQRQVLVMRFMLDLSAGEIAEILGTSSDVVRQHQTRAIRLLRERLAGIGRTPERLERRTPMRRGTRQSRVLRRRRFSLIRY
jgi:RNA polymerase sigma-70 factor (ECF subfamily)